MSALGLPGDRQEHLNAIVSPSQELAGGGACSGAFRTRR